MACPPIPPRLFALALATIFLSACRNVSTRELRDSEGRTFVAECDRRGNCKLERRSHQPQSDAKAGLALYAPGRVVGICDVADGADPESPSDCRPLICENDESCPPAHDLPHGSCLDGVCIDASNELSVPDAVMLCLAGTGLGRTRPEQIERFAMAQNCGTPCAIPKPCRQL
jgi:hypothetical protein